MKINIDPNKTEIILAGPGVGKTTELLNRVEAALGEGVSPLDIAFFSFSTTAVNEGLDRITKRLEYKKSQFRYFKTLHAMAYSLLGIDNKQVLSYSLLQQFAKANDLKISSIDWRTGIKKYQTPDSILLSQIDSARLLGMTVREYFIANHIEDTSIAKAEELAVKYQQFKIANGVIDFTDMILLANQQDLETPHFEYMFIDEAQDLSTQQWLFVEKLSRNAEHIVIVGDERQAIAEFAGADVDTFLSIKGKITTLNQSYRVPRVIYNLARKVEKQMIKTRNAEWKPRPLDFGEKVNGEIIRVMDLPIREMARGTWLILTRTNAQLQEFKEYMMQYCNSMPTFFTIDGQPPIDTDVFKAILLFESTHKLNNMTKYDFVMPEDDDSPEKAKQKVNFIMMFKKFMSSKNARTAELDNIFLHRFSYRNWFDAFDKLSIQEKRYIKSILEAYRKHPDGFQKSKIKLSTIHSAKGMEADNVILYMSLTGKVYNDWANYKDTNDTEAKVLFVAITRARKRLFLLGRSNAQYTYEDFLK